MAWTSPLTAVVGAPLTASQWNASVRDNLLETAPAKATTAGGYFVTTAANTIIERTIGSASVATEQTTTSTSYTDLTTAGPAVTKTTGTSALVYVSAMINNNTLGAASFADFEVTGASARSAQDTTSLRMEYDSAEFCRATAVTHVTGLTAGSNTFTMKYKCASGTGVFRDRHLIVQPL